MKHLFSNRSRARPPKDLLRTPTFHQLQWQLTASYIGVTVLATTLALFGLLIVINYFAFFTLNPFGVQTTVREIQRETKRAVPYMRHPPYDRERLLLLLQSDSTTARSEKPGIDFSINFGGGSDLLCVTDPKGRILAHTPETLSLPRDAPLGPLLTTEENGLVTHALAGETAPSRLGRISERGHLVIAVPIQDEQNRVLGVVWFRSSAKFHFWDISSVFLQSILPSMLLIGVGSAIVGTVFGAVAARRFTRRLGGIALAADAWAQGNWRATAPDSGNDEIARLARRLNHMAQELGDLFTLRRDIAAVQERHRLARDLHDTVKQQVFAAGLQIATARTLATQNPQAALTPLVEAEALIRQAQTELSEILRELRPLAADENHLPERLRQEITNWSRRTGIVGEFLASELFLLPEAHATELLRIVQEALSNAVRHSGATTVRIFLNGNRSTGEVTLSLSDNGRGFETVRETRRGGMGLSTMRERATSLPNGEFVLQSTPGAGTRIEVRYNAFQEQKTDE